MAWGTMALRICIIISIVLVTLVSGCVAVSPQGPNNGAAGAQVTSSTNSVERGAVSGIAQRVGFFYAVNPDCTSAGLTHLEVKHPPAHGLVAFVTIEDYADFQSGSQTFYACNKNKNPGISVVYTSNSDFTGSDHFSVQGIGPNGKLLSADYSITVVPRLSDDKHPE